jgi:ligand-binding sensor domain-containing protein
MPTGSKSIRFGFALLLALALFPAVAAAGAVAGGWTTYLRANIYTDLVAQGDTIWCASLDGGLLRYVSAADRFESFARDPGRPEFLEPARLASQALTALELDRSGRLWIGSLDRGVSRLGPDGTSWDLINELDGLPRGAVNVLRAVGDTMLIGTQSGVALWNGSDIVGVVPEGVNPSPFASDTISGVVLRGDSLWVSTTKGLYVSQASTGLSSWALADTAFENAALLALAWDGTTLMTVAGGVPLVFDQEGGSWASRGGIGTVLALSDDRGVIVASSDLGVYRWDREGWTRIPNSPLSSSCAVRSNPNCSGIVVATTDAAGRLWGANRSGLFDWTGATRTLHEPDAPVGNNIQNIVLQGSRVYIATFGEGVGRFDGTRWRNWFAGNCPGGCDTTFLNSAYAFSLLVDKQGRKWVGNWGTAMESFDDDVSPPQFTHIRTTDSLGMDMHTYGWSAACDSSSGRWFGMDYPGDVAPIGIEYYDSAGDYRTNYRPQNTDAMPSSMVRALLVDQQRGNLWVGYRGKGVTVFKLPETPGGPLVLASGGGLSAINTLDIFGIVAHNDSIWVMSTDDLRLFRASSLAPPAGYQPLPLVGSPAPIGACHPMDVGPDGTVWVGTDAGVHAYIREALVTDIVRYTIKEYTELNSPLAGDVVRAIRVDPVSGVVWIGTATGLIRFDPYWKPKSPEVRAYPNPVMLTGAGLTLRLAGNAHAYRGAVYDVSGRKLNAFDNVANDEDVFWDGRDASGALVRPGVYFVRVEAGGHARTVRVALLR